MLFFFRSPQHSGNLPTHLSPNLASTLCSNLGKNIGQGRGRSTDFQERIVIILFVLCLTGATSWFIRQFWTRTSRDRGWWGRAPKWSVVYSLEASSPFLVSEARLKRNKWVCKTARGGGKNNSLPFVLLLLATYAWLLVTPPSLLNWRASCYQAKVCHTIQSPVQATKCADVKLIASGGKKNHFFDAPKRKEGTNYLV